MKISELKNGMRRVNVEGVVVDKGKEREVVTRYGPARVVNATIKDDSGSITLTLWDDDISRINVGDKVKIENGYITSYRGNLQLNVGRYGKITIEK